MSKFRFLNRLDAHKPLHFFAIFSTCFLASLLVLYALVVGAEKVTRITNRWQKERIRNSFAFLKTIPKDKPVVLLLGTSEMQAGFDPEIFDSVASNRNLNSYALNMAVDNLGRWMPLYLARLEYELQEASLRPKIIFVHFPPSALTTMSRRTEMRVRRFFDFPTVMYNKHLLLNFDASLEEKSIALFDKVILGERSLLQIQRLLTVRPNTRSAAGAGSRAALWFGDEHHPYPAWDPEKRGAFYFNIDQHRATVKQYFKKMQKPSAVLDVAKHYEVCCDFYDLNMDHEYIEQLGSSLKKLKRLADNIVLIKLPENPMYHRSMESDERLNEALHKMAGLSRAEVWDLTEDKFSARDFIDVTHLSPPGLRYFSQRLAEKVPSGWLPGKTQN